MTASVTLRAASSADASLLLEWANDPPTRAASLTTAPIGRPEHVAWLARLLSDPRRRLWIGVAAGQDIGQVRIEVADDGAGVVSIALAPGVRGRGLARPLLLAGLEAAARELGADRARAVVRGSNEVARRLFEGSGFAVTGSLTAPDGEECVVYER
ncbi:MAG: hypothetical protein H6Q36_42 [Chloroflexi bacterium]|nr:hypothetical protein [Chloroflexota bacterium]